MIIKIILTVVAMFLCVYLYAQRRSLKRLTAAFFVLALSIPVVVWTPESALNAVANAFGVGRAADLAFYLLFVAFFFLFIVQYLHIRRLEAKTGELNTVLSIHLAEQGRRSGAAAGDDQHAGQDQRKA